jgi:hypothetical protein
MYLYAIVIALILVLGVTLWLVRRYLFDWMDPGRDTTTQAFTLADLRQLHKSGAITDEEFERAKAKIVEKVQASTMRQARDAEKTRGGGM